MHDRDKKSVAATQAAADAGIQEFIDAQIAIQKSNEAVKMEELRIEELKQNNSKHISELSIRAQSEDRASERQLQFEAHKIINETNYKKHKLWAGVIAFSLAFLLLVIHIAGAEIATALLQATGLFGTGLLTGYSLGRNKANNKPTTTPH